MRIEFVDLPVWAGGMLASEYDSVTDVTRINSVAVERIRERLGEEEARAFVTSAIAHERFHRDHPRASEADAHAFVRTACDANLARFESVLRA